MNIVERLRAEWRKPDHKPPEMEEAAGVIKYLRDRIEQLEAENAALRDDAERYRWLRDDNAFFPEEQMIMGGDDLDAAIDAARGKP